MRATAYVVVLSMALLSTAALADVPGLMNYQGTLTDTNGAALDTTVDMTFSIYTDSTGGTQVWTETQPAVEVDNGLFNVLLGRVNAISDTVFKDPERWLGVQVGGDPEMEPRQRIASVGYALKGGDGGGCNWSVSDTVLYTNKFWGLARGGAGNVLLGDSVWTHVNFGVQCTTGTASKQPCVGSSVGGGVGNRALCSYTRVGGGLLNRAGELDHNGDYAAVVGGAHNTASGTYAFVGGGYADTASGYIATVSGGRENTASGYIATVSGGRENTASGQYATVGGGYANTASVPYSTVAGGWFNTASGWWGANVGGGENNTASGSRATVAGGDSNTASGSRATVAGGDYNTASGSRATVAGGYYNTASAYYATVGGGYADTASGSRATVGGGDHNTASGSRATVAGGRYNLASGDYASVAGGDSNYAAGDYSVIPGGSDNTLTTNADYSMVFGEDVYVDNPYRVVFFNSTSPGRFGINRDDHDGGIDHPIHVGTDATDGNGAHLTAGGTWTNGSSRAFKENFQPLDGRELLAKVSSIPVEAWNFKNSDERHIGPCAEDFVGAFDIGTLKEDGSRENRYLAAGDVAGVALAGVKELIGVIEELRRQNAELEQRIAELERSRR